MFLFQLQSLSEEEEDARSSSPLGVKVKRKKGEELNKFQLLVDSPPSFSVIDKLMKDKDLSSFVSTLTPGAKNAINATSFIWGYENAVKMIKNAMKTEEMKNITDPVEKSRAFIENLDAQIQKIEKNTEVSKIIWSYYNEDLKDVQTYFSKSEAITEKPKIAETEKVFVPSNVNEALSISLASSTYSPLLYYCIGSPDILQSEKELKAINLKREELINMLKTENPVAVSLEEKKLEQEISKKLNTELEKSIMQRKDELVARLEQYEKDIEKAIRVLDKFSEQEQEKVKKIASLLPSELREFLLKNENLFTKKLALRIQLSRWLAFSRNSKKALSGLNPARILKFASLLNLLKR